MVAPYSPRPDRLGLITRLLILLVRSYQLFISPLLGAHCRFRPTCSRYAIEALKTHGALKGIWLTIKRVLKCHPLSAGGDDPVPPRCNHPNPREKQ